MSNSDNLVKDFKILGERLLKIRKNLGLSQEETAWAAGLSSRTYADIERGEVNARLDTILRICEVSRITPNDILIYEHDNDIIDINELDTTIRFFRYTAKSSAVCLINQTIPSLMEPMALPILV